MKGLSPQKATSFFTPEKVNDNPVLNVANLASSLNMERS